MPEIFFKLIRGIGFVLKFLPENNLFSRFAPPIPAKQFRFLPPDMAADRLPGPSSRHPCAHIKD
jgi:hypothetical protein